MSLIAAYQLSTYATVIWLATDGRYDGWKVLQVESLTIGNYNAEAPSGLDNHAETRATSWN
jgi:hypothetical protein